jgi:nicotinamide-nucleotide adenylyltransferase
MGHVRMIEYAASNADYLIIGLGSCNNCDEPDNPFSAEEREAMIKKSVDIAVPYDIRRIPDFGNPDKWVAWIKDNIGFDVFMTNSVREKAIFEGAGFRVEPIPFFQRELYCASQFRKRIIEGGDWEGIVPYATAEIIREIGGVKRIRDSVEV